MICSGFRFHASLLGVYRVHQYVYSTRLSTEIRGQFFMVKCGVLMHALPATASKCCKHNHVHTSSQTWRYAIPRTSLVIIPDIDLSPNHFFAVSLYPTHKIHPNLKRSLGGILKFNNVFVLFLIGNQTWPTAFQTGQAMPMQEDLDKVEHTKR